MIFRKEFGLERFIPASLLENMKRKEVRKLLAHFLKLHSSMAGPGKQLTALQVKLHYLDIVSQLPSYGAKCFPTTHKGDLVERVIFVSPKYGIGHVTEANNSTVNNNFPIYSFIKISCELFQPIPIANIEDVRRIEVRMEDELNRVVIIRLQNDQIISVSLDQRDATELVLVLKGYFHLMTGQNLPVDQEESSPIEDLAPPYLSQHKVIPEKWSYVNQNQMKTMCFSMQPVYQGINRKTNGLYNTMGRQCKPPLITGYSLDSNMNSSMSNKNHQLKNEFNSFDNTNSYDLQSVVSMEILESGIVEARNEEVLRRVQEMQQLVENSEKYLTEQQNLDRLNMLSEWQETSVDIESDNDSVLADDVPGKLKHSDSLLLLTKATHTPCDTRQMLSHAAIEVLRSETLQSESDNESLCTPHNSPKHKFMNSNEDINNKNSRLSFGLHSPDTSLSKDDELKDYLKHIRDIRNNETAPSSDVENIMDLYVFDPDLIDLTLIPPPATPDELDCALPIPINVPPSNFADSLENLNSFDVIHEDLEEFLASVTIPPPTQMITPAVELTPEEIMSYIIPPPPDVNASLENLTINDSEKTSESLPSYLHRNHSNETNHTSRRNSNSGTHSNVIEYATVDRKGAFSCCAKNKTKVPETTENSIRPPPRRASDEKPPERPPKLIPQERQRSQSLTSSATKGHNEFPPKLPPRGETVHHAPPHLFLPPKKPPLPPVPPLEILRQRKNMSPQPKANLEIRTAGIGSPHLQRNRNLYNDLDRSSNGEKEPERLAPCHPTAVSTPTSPHLGKYLKILSIVIPGDQQTSRKFWTCPEICRLMYRV